MNANTEVVVTGAGVVSPVGIGFDTFFDAMLEGKSGVVVRKAFEDSNLPLRIAAPVDPFEGKLYVKPRKAIKMMCRPIQFGYAAALLAMEHAGLDQIERDPNRVGTLFGTETFFANPLEVADVFRKCTIAEDYNHDLWGEFAMREIEPLWMLKYLPNMVTSHVSIAIDARGPSNSICQAEASGVLAIIEATSQIQRGNADIVVVGGTGSRMALNSMLYRGMKGLSHRVDEPEKASRPFDRDRDGIVAGEGAGVIILESAAHAAKRNANVMARVAGYSQTFATPNSAQFSETIAANFKRALDSAGLTADEISHVNAHADSTVAGDAYEAAAINAVFGDTPVVANKGNFGNLGPGSAVVETIATLGALEKMKMPPNRNFENPSSDCAVAVPTQVVGIEKCAAIKSSISSTGQITALVFHKN